MIVRSKSYTFAAAGVPEATLNLIKLIINLNDNRGLSTAEFCRAYKAGGIGGIGDPPEIDRQPAEHQQVEALRSRVPGAKGTVGGFASLGRRTPVFDPVKLLQFGLQS